jgi:BirA family transcriptional regulator, biotin operon repressor / biotin---[acetyl-CoA-carboxylase] ligase
VNFAGLPGFNYAAQSMSAQLRPTILRFETIDSTNLEAIRRAKAGADEGTCIVAREQTAGRGRLDRRWHSPKDAGLYLSVLLRPTLPKNDWPLLSLMSALAVVDALSKTCGISTDIKWPNDILANDRKLCGVLAETTQTSKGLAAIIGIGINLTREAVPTELRGTATSIAEIVGYDPNAESVLTELLVGISGHYEGLQADGGGEHTIREWCANSSFATERAVRVSLGADSFEGITRGLETDGALRVETSNGQIRIVRAGDVTAVRPTAVTS